MLEKKAQKEKSDEWWIIQKMKKITPLQEKLDVLAKKISTFAICAGVATFLCLTINLIFIYISDYKVHLLI